MNTLLLIAVFGAPQFDIQTLNGENLSGAIVAADAQTLVVEQSAGKRELKLNELLGAISKTNVSPAVRLPVLVGLHDGSRIAATAFEVANGNAKIKLPNKESREVNVKALQFVRFLDTTEKSDKLDAQWNETLTNSPAGDVLVVRQKGAIDSTEGVVGDITPVSVAFTLDGDKIEVKRQKVEGIVFARGAKEDHPDPVCNIVDQYGSRYTVKSVTLVGENLEVATPADFRTIVSLADVVQFDFSAGKLQFLSDLEPETFNYESFFGLGKPLSSLNEFYQLRRDVGLEKNPLKLDGRVYRKGIALHSRSVVVYRLPGRFRSFKAVAGIDDAARDSGGDVVLEIKGDGKSLWKESVRGNKSVHSIDLDISDVKRLEIVVDFGEAQDVADHLDLCDARITK